MDRQKLIQDFYEIIEMVEHKFSKQSLADINKHKLPSHGVYFFFEPNELRTNKTQRIVRVGTHGVQIGSRATLYSRLSKHKGTKSLSGNHHSSVFRKLIGQALINKNKLNYPDWLDRSRRSNPKVKAFEKPHEIIVSRYLSSLSFVVLEVKGVSSKSNDRAFIETNSIGLLSNFNKLMVDKCSENWLGTYTNDDKVIKSGLWNRDDVDLETVNPKLIDRMGEHLSIMENYNR